MKSKSNLDQKYSNAINPVFSNGTNLKILFVAITSQTLSVFLNSKKYVKCLIIYALRFFQEQLIV